MAALSIAGAAAKRYFCGMSRMRLDRELTRAALLLLGVLILLSGCNAGRDKSDEHRQDGFYGGVSGGVTRLP